MFSALYASCLKKINFKQILYSKEEIKSLNDIVQSNQFLLFCLFRKTNTSTIEFVDEVKKFVNYQNLNFANKNLNSSPGKLKNFFNLKKKKRDKNHVVSNKTAAIFINLELNLTNFNLQQIAESNCFLFFDSQNYMNKSRLLRALNFSGNAPALIVVDTSELVVTTNQGRCMLIEDPLGKDFPWTDPTPLEVFKGKYLQNIKHLDNTNASTSLNYRIADFSSFKPCVKGLYFGAKWCPPCKVITKQLISIYEKTKEKKLNFEIFFCSSDRSEESFNEHFSTMPWLAFPFDKLKLAQLTRLYDINGIPSFILLDEQNCLISRQGRSIILSDLDCKNFPWKQQHIYELNEFTMHKINDYPSLILFTEGLPEDNEFSKEILKSCANKLLEQIMIFMSLDKNNINCFISSEQKNFLEKKKQSFEDCKLIPEWADPLQVFYTGEDPICDFILESIGQGQADLPLLVICDLLAGHIAICDKPDISEDIINKFILDYRKSKTPILPLSLLGNTNEIITKVDFKN